MMDSSPSMDPSPKHLSLPCLGSHTTFPETLSSSISSVLPPISSMKDCPLPSPHKVSSADVISFLKANDSIKCNNMTSKGEHCPSIPKIILNTAINARNGHSALNGAVVAEAKEVLSSYPQTSTFAANLGNNGGLKDSSPVAPPKNILGKMKGTENQCNRSEKLAPGAHRPDQLQLVLSTYFGNVEKPASKGTACPFANVEGQILIDTNLRIREMELLNEYTLSLQAEKDLLRQKSRIQWLKAGDRNSSYFFKAINGRCNRSKIHSITSDDVSLIEGDIPVKNEAIRHFQNILGCSMPVRHGIGTLGNIIDNVISNDQADSMDRDVTNDEIREVWMASKNICSRKLGILLVKT
ncbi:hypothetical protein Dsin_018625 [Dipteronia sinensis]|uniref:Uncharacterized protein n=1 Tax=Dipteronia sinensis TaxID=43782 RepID=A0AAE0A6I4_9ROSI|nr:hypothetical protein Dsin_018625 [Dipteronia sinensis]